MGRHILDIAAALAAAMYLELNLLHLLTPRDELWSTLGNLSTLLLVLPILSLAARIADYLNLRAAKSPIVIKVSQDKVEARSVDGKVAVVTGPYSSGQVLIADERLFAEQAWEAVLSLTYPNKGLRLAPYVILTSDHPITAVEENAAVRALHSAGALHVEVADESFDADHPELFAQDRVPTNLA